MENVIFIFYLDVLLVPFTKSVLLFGARNLICRISIFRMFRKPPGGQKKSISD